MFGGAYCRAGASSSPATPGSRARGSRSGCTHLGAEVTGYALEPPTEPSLFDALRAGRARAPQRRATFATPSALQAELRAARPEVVFHLAAQPLVRASYIRPRETFDDERDGHRQRARGGPRLPTSVAASSSSPATSATRTTRTAAPFARTTRSAATIPTAPARGAPSSSRRPTAASFFARRSARPSPRPAPAT